MNSAEIRNTFLNYFKKHNHEIIHSSSLVPENDPTLMFANSGMVQFKNIFTGKEKRKYSRAVTSQKCVRAGGKHNDLENVGYTARHHTFFEMLGNFSFGDYFKDVAIELAWNLITKEFGIDKNKLLVTVYSDDEIALNYWKKIAGLSEDKIIKISTSDNFWSMGDKGPCGPCSEIFFDHGDKYFGGPPGSKDEDGDRFIEIWNLVFMQYEQLNVTKRINLPQPSIDTGMGLERVAALLQGTNDNYKTDIFTSLINQSIELSDNHKLKESSSHRVIADHLRSAAFLISDGVHPSNEGRGYVLRRIMRRGMRHAHTLGNKDPIFHKIFPVLLNDMKDAYPELIRANDLIKNTLYNEETKFKQTIDSGLKILEEEIKNTNNTFSGKVAFKLYDTYGFPLDLTQDFLKNKDIKVDLETFDIEMLDQKKRARKNWKGTGDVEDNSIWFKSTKTLELTEFLGYDQVKSQSIILQIVYKDKIIENINEGDEASIILNQTPFYGESGGQVGDSGFLVKDNSQFKVSHTSKIFDKYFIHWGKVTKGQFSTNDEITSSIDEDKRNLIRNNHSSTHLLHESLRQILGNHVTQKGSLVNAEKLRFDFSHNDIISLENINKLEHKVNFIIGQKNSVKTEILDHKSAINSGAMALFGEKYGDDVRVISMGENSADKNKNNIFSIELCGGTHVSNTGDIKVFKIINQSSVASGIRRIEAVTNIGVELYEEKESQKKIDHNNKIKNEILKYTNLIDKLKKGKKININKHINFDEQLKNIKKIYNDLQNILEIKGAEKNIKIEQIGEYKLIYLLAKNYPSKSLKKFIDDQKNIHTSKSVIVLISVYEIKVSIIIGITKDLEEIIDAKEFVKISSEVVGGKGGGGRRDLAQAGGNMPNHVNKIYEILKNEIRLLI